MKLARRHVAIAIFYCLILLFFSRFLQRKHEELDLDWDISITDEQPRGLPIKHIDLPKRELKKRSRRQDDFYLDPQDSEELEKIQFVQSLSVLCHVKIICFIRTRTCINYALKNILPKREIVSLFLTRPRISTQIESAPTPNTNQTTFLNQI